MGLRKISEKTGFTQLEIKVLLFLLIVFICGVGLKHILKNPAEKPGDFDYSVQDSLFINAGKGAINGKISSKDSDNNVDYKQEVLDFRKPDFNTKKTKELPAEKSIDINTAGKKTLENLPGIGPKTADKIITYRNKNGRFTKLEDLIKVKGIGTIKFNKIKKYLYIEK